MADVPIASLKAVARELEILRIEYVFTGGSIVGLLLDNAGATPLRPTDDVDVIVEVVTQRDYARLEERLRKIGFDHDTRTGAPICRWTYRNLIVDIMPSEGEFLGLNTAWFAQALAGAIDIVANEATLKVVSPAAFIATKLAAFHDRGSSDFYGSHDLEDIVTVFDGRAKIVEDLEAAPTELRAYVSSAIRALMANPRFTEALPGHLPSDAGSQARLPALEAKLKSVADLLIGE